MREVKSDKKKKVMEQMRQMYESGVCIYDIATRLGYPIYKVEKYMLEMGYTLDAFSGFRVKERKKNIFPCIVEGKKYMDITDIFNG